MATDTLVRNDDKPKVGVDLRIRCDRCGSQAFVLAVKNDLALTLCGHHGRKHGPGLVAQGFIVDDQTHLINVKASPSATEGE